MISAMRLFFAIALSVAGMFGASLVSIADEIVHKDALRETITQNGVDGAFAGYEVGSDRLYLVNAARAQQRFSPASTFKIANSLIALETGVIRDENEIIPYHSDEPPFMKEWTRDMSMREAIKLSNVPIYQELARRIGLPRYHEWLTRLSYGNETTSATLERFWLDDSLKISAVEEAHFVAALAQKKLPMSIRAQEIVRDILKYETIGDHTIYAKTGWCRACQPQVGWWVGWVERGGRIFAFALNINITDPKDLDKRIPIAKAILSKLGVI